MEMRGSRVQGCGLTQNSLKLGKSGPVIGNEAGISLNVRRSCDVGGAVHVDRCSIALLRGDDLVFVELVKFMDELFTSRRHEGQHRLHVNLRDFAGRRAKAVLVAHEEHVGHGRGFLEAAFQLCHAHFRGFVVVR